ncbi:probable myosin-binding protein 6 [Raphanus sativus]|uniref:Probable myosin-binding protein 6 n=1 Tax=Raphanus sativus TaxID=3726 RepID=A0A6J0K8Z3_RAPSA|nr:probable myosin-binding protein 6 [Raphanus sativus]
MITQLLCFFLFLFLLLQATMFKRSFKNFVEQELGSFPKFLIYIVLEWILITTLFIDGLLAFLSNQYARFFDLNAPCLLCTRIDHVLVPRDPHFYYNDSICDSHKKKVSSLAYCHVHKKLSEIKHMCEGCLLSFATEKESDCDTYKSLIGILHKDLELLIDDERDLPLGLKKDDNLVQTTTNLIDNKTNNSLKQHCSCCGELLKTKSEKLPKNNSSVLAPAPSPRVSYNKLSENESEFKDFDVEERTPSFVRGGNKFFGIPLSDSAQNSPRWSVRSLRKPSFNKIESATDVNGESILNQLKKEVRLDKKSLIDLYMELDEERNASAVAANNAMAMITKLQAEKAAVQMEALQYQRMMDEQAEYDQEALQSMSSDLAKKEEEFKELEAEFEAYRERYGCLTDDEDSREEFLDEYGNDRADNDASREEFLDGHGNARADSDGLETKAVSEFEDCSSIHEGDAENTDQTRSCKSEEPGVLVQMKSSEESSVVNGTSGEEEKKGSVSKEGIVKELSEITERLSALQSDGELLKHIADAIDISEGEAMLLQISQNLHMLRSFVAMPSES